MKRGALLATLCWLLLCVLAGMVAARATYTADLSAFLPRRASATQRLLVEQLREGPAAHLIFAAIAGGDPATRAEVSSKVASELRANAAFSAVSNGAAAQLERDREFLFTHRYALSSNVTPQRFTAPGLQAAISDSLDVLASPEGPLLKPLFTRDPTGEMLGIVDALDASRAPHTTAGVWSSQDGTQALLLAQTSAPGSDTDGQEAACLALQRAFVHALDALTPARREGLTLSTSGPPVFAVAARATIKAQVLRLSVVSSVLIATLLLFVYRSLPALAVTLVPVASGALAGVAAVALGFPAVHGITLGFGVTLIGEAVDYSIYLLIQDRAQFVGYVWPTIRLGVATSICGFAALLPSAFTGLAQLGLYSIAGLTAAALVTRFVLPAWLPPSTRIRDLKPAGMLLERGLRSLQAARTLLVPLALLAALTLYAHRANLWNRELAALSPVPLADQALDAQLREQMAAPDVRYMVVVPGADREAALTAAAQLGARLATLVDAGVIGGYQSPALYLPPLTVQRARRASLPETTQLRASLASALSDLPVDAASLEPFVADVERARVAPDLSAADLAGTSLAQAVNALLVHGSAGWSALLPVTPRDAGELSAAAVAALRRAVGEDTAPRAQLLDLKGEADALYAGYLREALQLAGAGFAAIVLLLAVTLRSARRVIRVVAPLALAVLAVAGLLVGLGHQLSILNVVGMLLTVAVGSNYGLFFDRSLQTAGSDNLPLTLASLAVANLATVCAFSVLACSSVPVLADLGLTVAPGALLALIFSAMLARRSAQAAS
jgi:predicted exporter